ncbi:Mth938-like domain-containing protein [Paracandidimonas soli]|uniref:Xcc1710-like domain-containing protein n=1 Tax=Paracandidimonas soli TaxID=1917182 RepID=A0A4R3V6Z9_9BURK|nr:MTH938/NDUFAF3 family protein [Paracandidimonas soli]TCU99203.1 uncharacterized protein EV686_104304 [Paracandidimonas soli]
MHLQNEANPALNTVTAYGSDYIEINEVRYRHAVHFAPEGEIHQLDVQDVSDFTAELLRELAGLRKASSDPMAFLEGNTALVRAADAPEVVLIGTGLEQRFLPHRLTQPLLAAGTGIEAMSTQAAARTYNILMAEGRRVVAALLPCKENA